MPILSHRSRWFSLFLMACLMTISLTACAKEDRVVFHGFEHNLAVDSPGVELLGCRYGDTLGTATAQEIARGEKSLDTQGCTLGAGETLMGDFLYVKWRDKASQQVFEDRVDLKSRLPSPKAMRGTTVYFLIDDNQLYVYLIPDWDYNTKRNHLPAGKAANGPGSAAFLDVRTLYPDDAPPKVRGGVR